MARSPGNHDGTKLTKSTKSLIVIVCFVDFVSSWFPADRPQTVVERHGG